METHLPGNERKGGGCLTGVAIFLMPTNSRPYVITFILITTLLGTYSYHPYKHQNHCYICLTDMSMEA